MRAPANFVLALSGPVGAGKTTVASGLEIIIGASVVSTRELIAEREAAKTRSELQRVGEDLDQFEGGDWVAIPVLRRRQQLVNSRLVIVDAVRTVQQVRALRRHERLLHVHLTAPERILRHRYEFRRRVNPGFELASFGCLCGNATEASSEVLSGIADVILDTERLSIGETLDATTAALLCA